MDSQLEEQVKKRLKEGWIHSVMMVEVLAAAEETAKNSLEKHIEKLAKEKKTLIGRKDFKSIRKIDNPFPNVEVAYSYVVEIEVLTENFETLVYLSMNYGPSSVEILHPKKIELDMGEAQGVLVSIADMIHRFARSGTGGVVVNT